MSEALRAGLVGYGHAGAVFHAPLVAATPRAAARHDRDRCADAQRAADRPQAALPHMRVQTGASRFLYTHPDITDVQVVGVPDERYMTVTGKIQKFKLRELAFEQFGLQTALVGNA